MTGLASSPRLRKDALALQPGPRLGETRSAATVTRQLRKIRSLVVSRADTAFERGGQARAIPRHRGGADHWHDVLGRLQLAVIGEQDEVTAGEIAVGRVQHRDVDHAVREGGDGSCSVSKGTNLANGSPYTWRSPGRQYGRSGHSGAPPRVSLPAARRRSLTVCRPRRRAVAAVTTMPFWSWAAAGVMT